MIRSRVTPLLALLLCAPPLRAQTLRGTVTDEVTQRPLAGAAVFLTDLDGVVQSVTRSAVDGSFALASEVDDTVRLRVERAGYEPLETRPWSLGTGSVLEMEVRLRPAPLALDTLTVVGRMRARHQAEFERRRRSEPWGSFIDSRELARLRTPRASQKLMALVPGMIVDESGVVRVRKRGIDINGSATCQPRYIVDGVRYPGDLSIDALAPGTAMRAVEFYENPQIAPAEFAMGLDRKLVTRRYPTTGQVKTGPGLGRPCAVLVIWTELGFADQPH